LVLAPSEVLRGALLELLRFLLVGLVWTGSAVASFDGGAGIRVCVRGQGRGCSGSCRNVVEEKKNFLPDN
jgi:hypothetical protein